MKSSEQTAPSREVIERGDKATRTSSRYIRTDIEGMRAVAVILVVLFHAKLPSISGGFVGVDVFFVISGFLITGMLVEELESSGRIQFWKFWSRRLLRLAPAGLVCLVAVLALSILIMGPNKEITLAKSAIATFVYATNIFFARQPHGYFAPFWDDNPYLHYWSLAAEQQFYVMWPLWLILLAWLGRRNSLVVLGVCALCALSLALSVWQSDAHPRWAFYFLPARVWEFGIGAVVWFIVRRGAAASGVIRSVTGYVGLAIVIGSAVTLTSADLFPGYLAAFPVLGVALMIWAGSGEAAPGPISLLSSRPAQWIGRRSYSIYLWHWPMLVLAEILAQEQSLLWICAALVATLIVSDLSFRFVELPIRDQPQLRSRPFAVIACFSLITAIGTAIAFGVWRNAEVRWASAAFAPYRMAAEQVSAVGKGRCTVWPPEIEEVVVCHGGLIGAERHIALIGDSHAGHWFTSLSAAAASRGLALKTYLKGSCPISEINVVNTLAGGKPNPECAPLARASDCAVNRNKARAGGGW